MKKYVNYLFVVLFIGAICLASYTRRQNHKEIAREVQSSLDSIKKDTIVVSVGVKGEDDTLIYNEGVFIKYPKTLNVKVSVSKSPQIKRKVVVFDSIYHVDATKGI